MKRSFLNSYWHFVSGPTFQRSLLTTMQIVLNTTMVSKLTLFLVLAAMCRGSEIDPVSKELGKGVDLRKINLIIGWLPRSRVQCIWALTWKVLWKEEITQNRQQLRLLRKYESLLFQDGLGSWLRCLVGIGLHTGCYTEQYCTKNRVKRISNKWYVLKHPRADREVLGHKRLFSKQKAL